MLNRIDQQNLTARQMNSQLVQIKTQIETIKVHTEAENEAQLSQKGARKMVDSMNDFLKTTDAQLKFVFHDQLNEYYVTIVNTATDEIIKEIPSKKLMDIHAAMKEFVGLLVDRKI